MLVIALFWDTGFAEIVEFHIDAFRSGH